MYAYGSLFLIYPYSLESFPISMLRIKLTRFFLAFAMVTLAHARTKDSGDHWAFTPLGNPDAPKVKQTSWPHNPVDHFVLRRLGNAGLKPSPEVDRRTWLRRVTLDLTGLPPTPAELQAFLEDGTSDAYAKVVDRLLASPRYGERWGQHWLDVVRYADTHGFEVNTERAFAFPYRDYVIKAFNADTPWNQFIREQIAGDALGKTEATGFLVTAAALLPGQIGKDAASKRLARQDELGEIVINTGEAFLGLSIGCARCHDHQFDPITAKDYYAFQAFFAGVTYGDRKYEDPAAEALYQSVKNQLLPIEQKLSEMLVFAGDGTKRAAVSAWGNIERFKPVTVTKVRFTIRATINNNFREPYVDEFEVIDAKGKNLALDAKVTVSGGKRQAKVNDGIYGNTSSWASNQKGKGWVQLEFKTPQTIQEIRWGRDRKGQYGDRLASDYVFEVANGEEDWQVVADSSDRLEFQASQAKAKLFRDEDILPEFRKQAAELRKARFPLAKKLQGLSSGQQTVFAARSNPPKPMHVLSRGDPEQPQDAVSPGTPVFLNRKALKEKSSDQERRLALADWIASEDNPLTARVAVNRIWQWHFGNGLVATPNDFGSLGVPPTHPELLDWLVREFIRQGWSVKKLHRLIVLSATYRQGHRAHADGLLKDVDNQLLWRFPTRRMEAESIRDSILAVSGQLDLQMYGRGYDLFSGRGGTGGVKPIESQQRQGGRRRMIYAYKIRMEREAVFGAFDCPDAGQSAPRRSQSTTPVQALNLFNSQFTIDLAGDFAKRVVQEVGDNPGQQIQHAWQLVFGREPSQTELQESTRMIQEHGLATVARVLFNTNEFLFLP